jgi:hypothetical protein
MSKKRNSNQGDVTSFIDGSNPIINIIIIEKLGTYFPKKPKSKIEIKRGDELLFKGTFEDLIKKLNV